MNTRDTIKPLLLTVNETAKMLAISPRKLWSLTNCGAIRCVRIDRIVRYTPEDLRAFVESTKDRTRVQAERVSSNQVPAEPDGKLTVLQTNQRPL